MTKVCDCDSLSGMYRCGLIKGHEGDHAAGNVDDPDAEWPNETEMIEQSKAGIAVANADVGPNGVDG